MRCGGVSLLGSYHTKNQDRFSSEPLSEKTGLLAVSDGLGSCSWSEIGAEALLRAAEEICTGKTIDSLEEWHRCLQAIHARWLELLADTEHNVDDCHCTALLCLILPEKLYCARLGDGMLGVMVDGEVFVLYDDKQDRFANETYCLQDDFQAEEWELREIPYTHLQGVLACTDGISIAAGKYESFTRDFMREYESKPLAQVREEITEWASRWRSNDDKTVAFILPEIQETQDVQAVRERNGAEADG